MEHRNNSRVTAALLCLITFVLATFVLLFAGVTFCRYITQLDPKSYYFTPAARETVAVYAGEITEKMVESQTLSSEEVGWEEINGGMRMQFTVANGTPSAFANKSIKVYFRLAAGLPVETPDSLQVTISYYDSDGAIVELQATGQEILPNTMQQTAYGDGWNYRFLISGEEFCVILPGGDFAYQTVELTVMGDVPATLLDLQIIGEYSD